MALYGIVSFLFFTLFLGAKTPSLNTLEVLPLLSGFLPLFSFIFLNLML